MSVPADERQKRANIYPDMHDQKITKTQRWAVTPTTSPYALILGQYGRDIWPFSLRLSLTKWATAHSIRQQNLSPAKTSIGVPMSKTSAPNRCAASDLSRSRDKKGIHLRHQPFQSVGTDHCRYLFKPYGYNQR